MGAFLEKSRHTIDEEKLGIKGNFTITKFWTNLIEFRIFGPPKSHEGIAKLNPILEQFGWQIFKSFPIKNES